MIIITTALYCEAKALIEKFGLKKDTSNTRFQVFMDREKEMLLYGWSRYGQQSIPFVH